MQRGRPPPATTGPAVGLPPASPPKISPADHVRRLTRDASTLNAATKRCLAADARASDLFASSKLEFVGTGQRVPAPAARNPSR